MARGRRNYRWRRSDGQTGRGNHPLHAPSQFMQEIGSPVATSILLSSSPRPVPCLPLVLVYFLCARVIRQKWFRRPPLCRVLSPGEDEGRGGQGRERSLKRVAAGLPASPSPLPPPHHPSSSGKVTVPEIGARCGAPSEISFANKIPLASVSAYLIALEPTLARGQVSHEIEVRPRWDPERRLRGASLVLVDESSVFRARARARARS